MAESEPRAEKRKKNTEVGFTGRRDKVHETQAVFTGHSRWWAAIFQKFWALANSWQIVWEQRDKKGREEEGI